MSDCSCEGWPHFYLCPRYKPSSLRRGSGLRRESKKQAARRRKLSALRKQMVEGGATLLGLAALVQAIEPTAHLDHVVFVADALGNEPVVDLASGEAGRVGP